ncbi:MAG TPA: MSHA biogenesis protein MshP [Noviherbaspirillum sp.]|uniref:MSHA biogenesis protein MshP n=1 Tax=Noviherbaspirillum sp. TaxID=1926288 RepID=UPI002B48FDC3|nr:MSHA biogenesis protein MshP [Noviherbaspirillum sp.]HJV84114.1 MSHA biogenesis protein MshP [Noviherbaspirillum sp.]
MKQRSQNGFGAIAAIVVLVILGALSAAMFRFSVATSISSAQDVASAKVLQAANAGIEWGLYQALQSDGIWRTANACNTGTQTLDVSADTGSWVTVRCTATSDYPEGESSIGVAQRVRGLRIRATACNSSAGCPNDAVATGQGYIERVREAVAFCPIGTAPGQCPP